MSRFGIFDPVLVPLRRPHRAGVGVGFRMGSIIRCKRPGCLPVGPDWESINDSPKVHELWCDRCGQELAP